MSSICPNCKNPYRPGVRFCANCGFALATIITVQTAALQPGQVMNSRYTIVRSLGKGGMGAIYLATETIANHPRQVVIKEMLDYYDLNDPQSAAEAQRLFENEAGTLVSLNYASIPQIFAYFSEGGRNYIVMQYIEGQNLETGLTYEDDQGKIIPGNSYPADQVRQWGIQVCKILEYLASKSVVHMDIKPANLIQDNVGNIWLVDFGTAKAQRVTQPGGQVGIKKSSVFGTAGYAPPEQHQGQYGPRSDVYALAATLYHLLTDDDPGVHPSQFPRLNQLPTNVGQALQSALEDNVKSRITAKQFRQLLEKPPILVSTPISLSPSASVQTIPQPVQKNISLRQQALAFFSRLAPTFDWMAFGALISSIVLFAIAWILFQISNLSVWLIVIPLALLLGLIGEYFGRKEIVVDWLGGCIGLVVGALVGFLFFSFADFFARLLGVSSTAFWWGGLIGALIGLVYQMFNQPRSWPAQGLLTILVTLALFFWGVSSGIRWAVQEGLQTVYYPIAERNFSAGNWQKAQTYYHIIFRRDQTYKDVYSKMLQSAYNAGTECLAREDWGCAQEEFAFIIGFEPEYSDASHRLIETQAEPHYREGMIHLSNEAWKEAQAEFEVVIIIDSGYKDAQEQLILSEAEPHYRKGMIDLSNAHWTDAQGEFEAVMAIDSDFKDVQLPCCKHAADVIDHKHGTQRKSLCQSGAAGLCAYQSGLA